MQKKDRESFKAVVGFEPAGNAGRGEFVWNLFVQILLPLLLISTFAAVTLILQYKDVADNERDRARRAWEDVQRDPSSKEGEINSLREEMQLLKLIKGLDQVFRDERARLYLDKISSPTDVNFAETMPSDEQFRQMCIGVLAICQEERYRYQNNLYTALLKRLNFRDYDINGETVRRWDQIPEPNFELVIGDVISARNRAEAHNRIIDFVRSLEIETAALQSGVLQRIFEELVSNPERGGAKWQDLVKNMVSATNAEVRTAIAVQLFDMMISKRQDDLKERGYVFLQRTWDQVRT